MCICVNPLTAYADEYEYDGDRAAWTADLYSHTEDGCVKWMKVKSDCTNFISYCLMEGGLQQKKSLEKLTITGANNTTEKWFAYRRNRGWAYSTSWTVVTDLRGYLNKSTDENNRKASVTKYIFSNTKSGDDQLNKVLKTLKKGDIVQYDENGYRHTVMITEEGNNMNHVCYSAHNRARNHAPMTIFVNQVKIKCELYTLPDFYSIYIIKMKK